MSRGIDILGIGVVAVDDLLFVERYPPADSKTRVIRRERQCGGLTGTALVAASRLGARCAYAGMLGNDPLSRFIHERLEAENIDLSHAVDVETSAPCHSVIIVDMETRTRTIFSEIGETSGPHPDLPPAELIRSAKVLFVDHWGIEGVLRAARIAKPAGIPIVADLEREDAPRFNELLGLVDHLIVSRSFASRLTGQEAPGRAARALWSAEKSTVVVTAGEEGCWFVDAASPGTVHHQRAFEVDAVDTTGCGDVFHGAYACGVASGRKTASRIEIAAAAAAIKATKAGGQAGAPTAEAVEAFLRSRQKS